MNYSFPATKWAETATIIEQFDHVRSEFEEMSNEAIVGDFGATVEEAVDLYHSLETWFRILELSNIDMDDVFKRVQNKNESRGYYENHQRI
jgi:hypothetical protein